MIRDSGPIKSLEDWVGKDVVLTIALPGERIKAERVQLVSIEGFAILCRDISRRDQVYFTQHLLGWEPYDAQGIAVLEEQAELEFLEKERFPPSAPKEDSGVREVAKVRKVIQRGSIGSPVKMR